MEKKIFVKCIHKPLSNDINVGDLLEVDCSQSNFKTGIIAIKINSDIIEFHPLDYFKFQYLGNDEDGYEFILDIRNLPENTITKLEERETDSMNEEIKSMKTLEACAYLQNHKDEYLVAKNNENFELHFDGKEFLTHFKTGDNIGLNKLTLDFSTLNTEWIKVDKLYTYVFIGCIDDKTVFVLQESFKNDKEAEKRADELECQLDEAARNFESDRIYVSYENLYDVNLNPVIQIKA